MKFFKKYIVKNIEKNQIVGIFQSKQNAEEYIETFINENYEEMFHLINVLKIIEIISDF